ncbi:Uncharacterised protein [Escherichia coli]|nr:Uncharacterised protein [Escherichia coli]
MSEPEVFHVPDWHVGHVPIRYWNPHQLYMDEYKNIYVISQKQQVLGTFKLLYKHHRIDGRKWQIQISFLLTCLDSNGNDLAKPKTTTVFALNLFI